MKNRVMILILSTFVVAGVACKAKMVKNNSKTIDKPIGSWQLVEINSRNLPVSPENTRTPSIVINDTTTHFGGNNGCNSFGGVVKFNNDSAKFDIQFSTKMYCINAIDGEFDSTLQVVNTWQVDNKRLLLKKDATILMQFIPTK